MWLLSKNGAFCLSQMYKIVLICSILWNNKCNNNNKCCFYPICMCTVIQLKPQKNRKTSVFLHFSQTA